MKNRTVIALLLSLGLITLFTAPASAHAPSNYPYAWTYSITSRAFYYKTSYPTGAWRNRFADAMVKWNGVTGASLTFSVGGAAQPSDGTCGPRDIISNHSIDGPGKNLALTYFCSTQNSTVEIVVDTAESFDAGDAAPNDPSKWDLQGVLTHELGHATRGWMLCIPPDDPDDMDPCQGQHYDNQNNLAICDIGSPTTFSTMCYSTATLPKADSWRKRSLEQHDEDIFATAY